MADGLSIISAIYLLFGLIFSALITYRDFRALGRRDGYASFCWQTTLVTFDLIQDFLLLCSTGLSIFMILRAPRPSWAELIVLTTVQFMSGTNVRTSNGSVKEN